MSNRLFPLLACLGSLILAAISHAKEKAPDFPPGQFNDGGQYRISDFEGKVVVLFFYEKDCPRCKGSIPERNAIVKQYEGKPVIFLGVAAGDTLQQAKAYVGGTKLAMPVFADPLSLMEKRYGQTISLQNIWQFRVIGPDGNVVAMRMEPAAIDRALEDVKLKYNPDDYHARLRPTLNLFEFNQYPAGMKSLRGLLKNKDKEVADSAAKLLEAVKAEGNTWMSDAEEAAKAEDSVQAYDLYSKVITTFGTDDLAKKASEAIKPLRTNDKVKAELEARKMYERMTNAMAMARPEQKSEVARFAAGIVKKYPDTPTGKKAEELQKELGG
jgi:peroxiredoxin